MDSYSILSYANTVGKPAVLATLIHVEGHSYRKAGASMLLLPDGSKIGSLSPGCLEADLQERIHALLDTGDPELVVYNMRPEEDAIWGEATGCGGILQIMLEPLNDPLLDLLAKACHEVDAGAGVELIRYAAGRQLQYELKLERENHEPSSKGEEKRRQPLFSTRFASRPRLFVFGSDDGTIPITKLARKIGFRIAVSDWRSSLCNVERFPEAELAVGSPEFIIASLGLRSSDYIVICSHQMHKDREMLERVLPLGPAYLGVMGSKSRIDLLFEGLPQPSAVSAPVGLDIGAEGPEEIAISIAAELIAVRKSQQREQGEGAIEYRRDLFGSRSEQENGNSQAFIGACAR
jgi:xanthine dehydrogenase accessory factor